MRESETLQSVTAIRMHRLIHLSAISPDASYTSGCLERRGTHVLVNIHRIHLNRKDFNDESIASAHGLATVASAGNFARNPGLKCPPRLSHSASSVLFFLTGGPLIPSPTTQYMADAGGRYGLLYTCANLSSPLHCKMTRVLAQCPQLSPRAGTS